MEMLEKSLEEERDKVTKIGKIIEKLEEEQQEKVISKKEDKNLPLIQVY